ncbi:basic proline-rich protein-like [Chiroxiphia lanceolata]|uniref:basic proline-rich protein-like n=1 Tax=Chiroxiphia lanceolata TaxID=296741 RepID=UPI0013CE93B0|nr:basic proline-rich protein-like [Chiroxiphia lanceolata]
MHKKKSALTPRALTHHEQRSGRDPRAGDTAGTTVSPPAPGTCRAAPPRSPHPPEPKHKEKPKENTPSLSPVISLITRGREARRHGRCAAQPAAPAGPPQPRRGPHGRRTRPRGGGERPGGAPLRGRARSRRAQDPALPPRPRTHRPRPRGRSAAAPPAPPECAPRAPAQPRPGRPPPPPPRALIPYAPRRLLVGPRRVARGAGLPRRGVTTGHPRRGRSQPA